MNAAAWMPLAWLALWETRDRITGRWMSALAAALCMAALAGFPAMTAVVFLASALWAVVLWRVRAAAALAAAAAWAVLLAAAQLLPTLELVGLSTARQRAMYFGGGGGVPWQGLVSMVSPNHFRIFSLEEFGKLGIPYNPTFLYLYASLPALLLAAEALATLRDSRTRMAATLTAAGCMWMMGENTPVWRALYPHLPASFKSALYPEFAASVFLFGIGWLAAITLDRFVPRRAAWAAWLLAGVIAWDLTRVGAQRHFNLSSLADQPGVSSSQFEGSSETLSKLRELAYQARPPWRLEIREDSRRWVNGALVTRVPNPNGSDPLALERMLRIRRTYGEGVPWLRYYEIADLDSRLPDMMNVKYLVSYAPSEDEVLRHPKWRLAARLPGHQAFENLSVLERFYLVAETLQVNSEDEGENLLKSKRIDPGRTALVEGPAPRAGNPGQVEVLDYQPESIRLRIQATGPAFLVTSESWYPGWRAWIDGQESPLVLTNLAFRGLAVPAGSHEVTMRFGPAIRWRGLAISLAAWAFWLAVTLRKRNGSPHLRS